MEIAIAIIAGAEAGKRSVHEADPAAPILLGRGEESDVPLWDEAASRRHAILETRPDGLWLVDLGSANGTYVGSERIDRRRLAGGEEVRIGATILRIETPGFRRRSTEVLRPDPAAEFLHVMRRVPWDAVDLGSQVSADEGRARRLNALLATTRTILAAEGGAAILAAFLEGATDLLGATGGCLVPCAARSGDPLWGEILRTPPPRSAPAPSRSLVERVLEERAAIVVADPAGDARARGRVSIAGPGVGSWIAAPVVALERIGAVALFSSAAGAQPFGAEELALAATLGQVTGLALAAAERLSTSRELLRVRDEPDREELLGTDPAFLERVNQLERFAAAGGPLLIVGETGTGKELLARRAHRASRSAAGPWIALNCAAIPPGLLESELFGHEAGAFTGAIARRPGMFELADGGALFLDEIGELPLDLQPKLLRVLESGEFYRIGGAQPVRVGVLVISATHRDLEARARTGAFREDLLHRLARFRVEVPPLRDRPGDLRILAAAFLERATRGRSPGFAPAAWEALRLYPWPGNVRELRNAVERAAVLAGERAVRAEDLALRAAPDASTPGAGATAPPEPRSLAEAEEAAIRAALLHTGGRRGEAARILGIAPPTLRRKLRALGLDAGVEEDAADEGGGDGSPGPEDGPGDRS